MADFGIGEAALAEGAIEGIGAESAAMAGGGAAAGGAAAAGGGGYLAAGSTAAAAGASLYSTLNAPKMSGFQTGSASSKDTEAVAYAQALALRQRRGAASTILTGPMGVTGNAPTQRATLGT
jgi:hypothetical protein